MLSPESELALQTSTKLELLVQLQKVDHLVLLGGGTARISLAFTALFNRRDVAFFLIRCCRVPLRILFTATPPNFLPQLMQQVGCQLMAPFSDYQESCFSPRRSLSSIITRGGLESDSGRQLRLTVWGPNVNSTPLGKQGWWWPLLPKVCGKKWK